MEKVMDRAWTLFFIRVGAVGPKLVGGVEVER